MPAVSRGLRLGAAGPEGRGGAAAGRAEEGDRAVAGRSPPSPYIDTNINN